MFLNVCKCPNCGGQSFAVEVKTWLNVIAADECNDDYPCFDADSFDEEDADSAEPIDGGGIICRNCSHIFPNDPPAPEPHSPPPAEDLAALREE